jgi:hypothetical protein
VTEHYRTTAPARSSMLRKAAAMESGVWRSLYHWPRRRHIGVGPDDHTFAYAAAAAPILWVFVGLSAFEIPLLHLVLPWPVVRVVFLILGAWGLIWMIGFLASYYVHPHVVGSAGIRVRNSMLIDIPLAWDLVKQIRPHKRTSSGTATLQYEPGAGDTGIVHVTVSSMTNVEIVLNRPILVAVPKLGEREVTVVRCYADDPAAFIARARQRLADFGTAG